MRPCPFKPFDFAFPKGPHNHNVFVNENSSRNALNHPTMMPHMDSKNFQNVQKFEHDLMDSMDHIMDELLKPMIHPDGHHDDTKRHHGQWTKLSPLALTEDKDDHVFLSDHKYQIKWRTEGYSPQELTVRTLNDLIIVEGKHEETTSNSESARYFFKKWRAPEDVMVDRVLCHVNVKYGYMQIDAPRHFYEDPESLVPIKVKSPFGSPINKVLPPWGSPPRKVHFDGKKETGPEVDKIIMEP